MDTIKAAPLKRLDEIRGPMPRISPSVRVLADYTQHTDCQLATLGFMTGTDFGQMLKGTRYESVFRHSPFAVLRGLTFENLLRKDDYALTLELLRGPLALPLGGVRVVNLREGFPSGSDRMPARVKSTLSLLKEIIEGKPTSARLIDGAVLAGSVGGLSAYFEADALTSRYSDGKIRVTEVKSFPKVDGRVDAEQLGAALDQAAIYILLTRLAVANLSGDPIKLVSDKAILITPQNVGLTPTLSEQRVTARITRIQRVLAAIPEAHEVAAATPADIRFGPVIDQSTPEQARIDHLHDIANRVGTTYSPSCLSSCGNARFCRERAIRAGSPCTIGPVAERLLPEVLTLNRAESLTHGVKPTPVEAPAAAMLERAGRLIDEAISQSPSTRRTA